MKTSTSIPQRVTVTERRSTDLRFTLPISVLYRSWLSGLVIGFIAVGFEGSLMFVAAGVLAGLLIGNLVGWIKVQFSS